MLSADSPVKRRRSTGIQRSPERSSTPMCTAMTVQEQLRANGYPTRGVERFSLLSLVCRLCRPPFVPELEKPSDRTQANIVSLRSFLAGPPAHTGAWEGADVCVTFGRRGKSKRPNDGNIKWG